MRVRVIKADNCPKCKTYLDRLDKAKFKYESYDGKAPANKEDCDKWGIDDMPVVQILNNDGAMLYQFPAGTFSPRAINFKVEELNQKGKSK